MNDEFILRKNRLIAKGLATDQALNNLRHELNAKYFGLNTNPKLMGPVKPTSHLNPFVKSPIQSPSGAKATGGVLGALGVLGAIGMAIDDYNDDGVFNFSPTNDFMTQDQLDPCPNAC